MSKPLIALVSSNAGLTSTLHSELANRFRVAVCDSVEEAVEFAESNRIDFLVADFLAVRGGGHVASRFLDDVRSRNPQLTPIVLLTDECPAILRQSAEGCEILADHQSADASGIVACLENLAAAGRDGKPEADHPAEPEAPADDTTANGTADVDADPTTPEETLGGIQDAEPIAPTPAESTGSGSSSIVLTGITRRFETETPQMHRILAELEVAARHDVTILLIGETGSGKTFLSRLIHEVSPRRNDPFLTVACGALPAELIESELFGHVKGAFTGAHADKEGKFLAAGKGTVLLDEIDVLGPEQQVKLLRVIETGEFEPVGSNQTMTSQARLVVASNLDLQPLVEQGKFRPDLYYRLNMLKFNVLPLRERRPDIPQLARKFIDQLSTRHGVRIRQIDDRVFEVLTDYPWPGNVRELENVIRRAVIYSTEGTLAPQHLPANIRSGTAGPTNDPTVNLKGSRSTEKELSRQIELTEREVIEEALFRNRNSRTNTAKELGISRVTLYNKMKKYGI